MAAPTFHWLNIDIVQRKADGSHRGPGRFVMPPICSACAAEDVTVTKALTTRKSQSGAAAAALFGALGHLLTKNIKENEVRLCAACDEHARAKARLSGWYTFGWVLALVAAPAVVVWRGLAGDLRAWAIAGGGLAVLAIMLIASWLMRYWGTRARRDAVGTGAGLRLRGYGAVAWYVPQTANSRWRLRLKARHPHWIRELIELNRDENDLVYDEAALACAEEEWAGWAEFDFPA